MGIIELFSSFFGGGLAGLIGAVVQRFFEYKSKQLEITANKDKYAHELLMRDADAKIMQAEWAAKIRVAEVEAAGKEGAADAEAFAASFKEPTRYSESAPITTTQTWLLVGLDVVRGLVRPGLTLYLSAITTVIFVQALILMEKGGYSTADAAVLVVRVVDTILYLTTACVLWWFGSRVKNGPPRA